jgi:hypothetical protein
VTNEDDVEGENSLHQALGRLRAVHGLITASLVEPDSAHVLQTVVAGSDAGAASTADTSAVTTVAAAASDVAQVIGLMAAGLGEADDLEDVIITFGRRHHLITPVPTAGADGLLIVVTLDRARTNLAIARQQLRALGPLLDTTGAVGHAS